MAVQPGWAVGNAQRRAQQRRGMERSPKGALERLRRDLRLMEGELGVDVSAVLKHLHLALEEFDNHPMRCVRCFGRGTIKCLMCGGTGELQLAPARLAAQRARGHSAAGYDHRTSTCTCTRCDGKTVEACSECCGYGLC